MLMTPSEFLCAAELIGNVIYWPQAEAAVRFAQRAMQRLTPSSMANFLLHQKVHTTRSLPQTSLVFHNVWVKHFKARSGIPLISRMRVPTPQDLVHDDHSSQVQLTLGHAQLVLLFSVSGGCGHDCGSPSQLSFRTVTCFDL